MSSRTWLVLVLASVVSLAGGGAATAQDDVAPPSASGAVPAPRAPRANRPGSPPGSTGMTVQQVEQYFDQVVLNQARARLKLGDAQFFQFGGALRRLQTLRRQQQRQRMALIRQLSELSTAAASDDALTAKTRELDEFMNESFQQLQDARSAIDAVLDVRQRAEFRVFEELMERRKLDLLTRARRVAETGRAQGPTP